MQLKTPDGANEEEKLLMRSSIGQAKRGKENFNTNNCVENRIVYTVYNAIPTQSFFHTEMKSCYLKHME